MRDTRRSRELDLAIPETGTLMLLREDFWFGTEGFQSFAILFSDQIRSETGCEPA
jgi:hypothetical protein